MALTINTNIASLNAQQNLTNSQSALQTSLQRLSSGMRINSSKDDAAGLAISDRMTAQINGLDQATRNANDGVSLAQTADGTLAQVSHNLQSIRTLAVQSANSTNSASDRASLNAEAQQLLSEIQRVATSAQFNGQNILDGTFTSAQFQVGANANQTITASTGNAQISALGSYQASSSAVTSSPLDGTNFTINGTTIGVSADTSAAGVTADSATAKATAINAKTALTGVSATAANSLVGSAPIARSSIASGDLLINGIAVGAIASDTNAVTQGNNAATAINALTSQTGVSAIADASTGALTLSTTDGRNIALTSGAGTAAGAAAIQNTTGLDVSAGANASGHQVTDLTLAGGISGSGTGLADHDTVTVGGKTYEFALTASSVTAGNVKVDIGAALGGTAVASGNALKAAVQAQYTAGNTSVVVSGAGVALTFTDAKVGGTTAPAFVSATGVTTFANTTPGTAAADGNGVTTRGTLTLNSASAFTVAGSNDTYAGLSTASSALTKLSTVDISSVAGSNSAIALVDGAISQIDSIRGSLGALQNRFLSVVSSLTTSSNNLSAARSQIQDTNYAAETATMTRNQILQQAGVAMLAQANALPNLVLSLLK